VSLRHLGAFLGAGGVGAGSADALLSAPNPEPGRLRPDAPCMQPKNDQNTRHDDLTSGRGNRLRLMPTGLSSDRPHFRRPIGHLTYLGEARRLVNALTIVSVELRAAY